MKKLHKCDYCKEISEKTHLFDLNWITGYPNYKEGDVIPRDQMDLHRYCTIDCQENDIKARGLWDAYKKKISERAANIQGMRLPQDKPKLNEGFSYRRSKDHGGAGCN